MFTLFPRRLARLGLAGALAVATTLVLADASVAASRKLSGTHSAGEVAGACLKAGGSFTSGSAGDYSCRTEKGIVSCDDPGHCTGYCDKCASVAKGGLNGVLRPPASAGTTSATGSSASTQNKKPVVNVGRLKLAGSGSNGNQAGILRRFEVHSGSKH